MGNGFGGKKRGEEQRHRLEGCPFSARESKACSGFTICVKTRRTRLLMGTALGTE